MRLPNGSRKSQRKPGISFSPVLPGDLLAHLAKLRFVADHNPEMPHSVRLRFFNFEDSEELMLAEFEESVTFALVELLEVKNVLIERDRLLHVVHFNGDVIASI